MMPPSAHQDDPPQATPIVDFDWRTWSPFQSKIVRDICVNMTDAEKSTVTRRGATYGVWVAISFALPGPFLAMGLLTGRLSMMFGMLGGLLILAHIACIPIWQRRQRKFLCSTVWARENGIKPNSLKLFNWHRTNDSS